MKMIDDCLPDMYVKSVYDIDYKKLYDEGIRYALFDVDSTLLPFDNIDVRDEHLKLFDGIRNLGIQTALYSNGSYRRVKPVADKLNVKFVASAHKPVYKGFKVIKEMFDDKCEPVNTIFVGDSLLVDMLFADKCGVKKILVDYIPDDGFNIKGKVVWLMQVAASKALENKGFSYGKKYYLSKGE